MPSEQEMRRAFGQRDASYDGIFFVGVRSTGIVCRPSCPARKPKPENMVFFPTVTAALAEGFRPCKRCRPDALPGQVPDEIKALLDEIEHDPGSRLRDADLAARSLDPVRIRRWFKANHGMTFQAYHRARRLAHALGRLLDGAAVTDTAFDSGFDSTSGFRDAMRRLTGKAASASRATPVIALSRLPTPLGPMLLGCSDQGICLLEFIDRRMLETQLKRLVSRSNAVFTPGINAHGRQLDAELNAYFNGRSLNFETPIHMVGSDFQKSVWQLLRQIPPGQTISYGEQAQRLGRPGAARAVARANGDNPLAIIVPCHRVIGANGRLTGYGGGLWRKRWLLNHEREAIGQAE